MATMVFVPMGTRKNKVIRVVCTEETYNRFYSLFSMYKAASAEGILNRKIKYAEDFMIFLLELGEKALKYLAKRIEAEVA